MKLARTLTAAAAIVAAAVVAVTPAGAAARRPVHHATAATCTQDVADYQYATTDPMQVLTATTASCRTGAPWVLTIHGGSWINGTRADTQNAVDGFYSYGWQAFNMEYRRGSNVTWAQQGDDVLAAYRWVLAHASQFGLDPLRGTVYGFSAGGHMAAWLGARTSVSSVVTASGVLQPQRVADDDNGLRPDTEPTSGYMHGLHVREVAMMGCDWNATMTTDCRAAWDAFDPETAITAASAPTFMLQGDADPCVPPPTVDAYAYHLRQAGVPAVAVHVAGLGHTSALIFGAAAAGRFYDARAFIAAHWGP